MLMFIVIKLHLDLNPPSDHMLPICPVFYFFSPFWMIFSDFFFTYAFITLDVR